MNAASVTAAASLALAILAVGGFAARWVFRIGIRIRDFLDDWAGQAARPGIPERPGVMARLAKVEQRTERIEAETRPNGGHSLRDVVHRTAADVADLKQQFRQQHGTGGT